MPQSLPTLCGSIMGSPFSLSAKIHNAAYAALGLDYTFVCFGIEDPVAGVAAIRTLGVRGMIGQGRELQFLSLFFRNKS